MIFETVNIFPTTLYVGKMEDHDRHKEEFYKVYPKFDYPQTKLNKDKTLITLNTISENEGNPLIHQEESLSPLFAEITRHIKCYCKDVLRLKDVFDVVFTKSWLSRSREANHEIPWHLHSTSHVSFVYYLNTPENSQLLQFSNEYSPNSLFKSLFLDDPSGEEYNIVEEFTEINAETFGLTPIEGNLILFPSKIPHCTKSPSDEFNGERLAIVGDVTLVLKEEYLSYSYGYINEKYWKKFV
jgi:hypothetical protein